MRKLFLLKAYGGNYVNKHLCIFFDSVNDTEY